MKAVNMLKDINNNCTEDEETIKAMFQNHFKNLFTSEIDIADWFHTQQRFPVLNNSVLSSLGSELHTTEIKQALFHMAAWKSPGPDRFLAGFYQNA